VRRDIFQGAEAVDGDAKEHCAVEADVVKCPVVE
jgi:hypothetical protein